MSENIYKNLADTFQETIAPLLAIQTETTQMSINALGESLKNITSILTTSLNPSASLIETSKQLSYLCKIMLSSLTITDAPPISDNAFDFLEEIDFQNEYIELTEENCDSINELLDLTDTENSSKVMPADKTPTIQFIISVLVPIIIGFLQLWQNEEHYKLDSIEAQNVQMQEQENYEQIMQKLSDIIDSLNELQESQESCPCNHSDVPALQDEVPTDMPDVQLPDGSAE